MGEAMGKFPVSRVKCRRYFCGVFRMLIGEFVQQPAEQGFISGHTAQAEVHVKKGSGHSSS